MHHGCFPVHSSLPSPHYWLSSDHVSRLLWSLDPTGTPEIGHTDFVIGLLADGLYYTVLDWQRKTIALLSPSFGSDGLPPNPRVSLIHRETRHHSPTLSPAERFQQRGSHAVCSLCICMFACMCMYINAYTCLNTPCRSIVSLSLKSNGLYYSV